MTRFMFNGLLVLAALFSPTISWANPESNVPETVTPIETVSVPVIQPLPIDDRTPELWLTGRVSLVGGEVSSSEQQFHYASEQQLPFMKTEVEYLELVAKGYFVPMESPYLSVLANRKYTLPSTAAFVIEMSRSYFETGCGQLVVTDAVSLTTEKRKRGSIYSVHPTGMAVDLRVRNIGERCENWMNEYLTLKEAEGKVDATREHWKVDKKSGRRVPNPHFHLVVPLQPRGPNLLPPVAVEPVGAP